MSKLYGKLFDLSGKVALVTGGSGGLGGAVALALSDYGAKVVITGRRQEVLESAAKEISSKTGGDVKPFVCDVSKEQSVKQMVGRVVEEYGRIDVLANFFGLNVVKPAEDYPYADWEEMLNANTNGLFLCCKEVGKVMITQKMGRIINVSSVRSENATALGSIAYCTNKAAANMITKQLACEWAKYNVRVNAVAPSVIRTALTAHHFSDPKNLEKYVARVPLGRLGETEDLAGAVLFLASDASNYITGQVIFIDGGITTATADYRWR